jgi:predicted AAA+ superfamily ATPase
MIHRCIKAKILQAAQELPVVAIIGPWQSGKTTVSRMMFPLYTYVNLEDLDIREFAVTDPRGFLKQYRGPQGLIIDEIQHVPQLLSYIQTIVDTEKKNGYFVITGSQNFLISQAISQTLAGRIAILTLLPFSISEMKQASLLTESPEELIFKGCYPRIYTGVQDVTAWYNDYILTYIERDVRQLHQIQDLSVFKRFMKLCAGRIGQLLNISSLANDAGVSVHTARGWLSILEASYIIYFLHPHFQNFSKRLIKSPKLYFYDTGIASALLGIQSKNDVDVHYLRGGLFESLMISDLAKQCFNMRQQPNLYFWRDNHGHEVDCIYERGMSLTPCEIKAGKTITSDYFKGLEYWNELSGNDPLSGYIIYAGDESQSRTKGNVVGWKDIDKVIKFPV